MSNFTKTELEIILASSILGDKYIYSFSNMAQTKAGTRQTLFIGDIQYYVTPDCQLAFTTTGLRAPMSPKQRVIVSRQYDFDQSKLIAHLKDIYGEQFTESRYGPLPEFTLTIAKLSHAYTENEPKRIIYHLFSIVDKHKYSNVLTNMYILHQRGHIFNISLPDWMSTGFYNGNIHIKTTAGNQTFQYSLSDNDCAVELNPVANGENVLTELMLVMSNLIALNELSLSQSDSEANMKEEEGVDFIESLHDVARYHCDTSLKSLRLKLERMLTSLKLMGVYHGHTQIDKISEMVNRGNRGGEVEVHFIGSDISSKVLLIPARVAQSELITICTPGKLDFNPSHILELMPPDNLMYPMLDGLIEEAKEGLNDYRLNCKRLNDMQEYLPEDGDE